MMPSNDSEQDGIRQTRENYERFFNNIDDFLFILDERGSILFCNETVRKRLGYKDSELLGRSVLMVHPPQRREEAARIVGEMLAGTTAFCPVPILTKSGTTIPVETRVRPGVWDGRPVLYGVAKDISRLALSEEKYAKSFHINPSACGLSDLATGAFIEVNEGFLNLFGFTREEVIGKTAVELGILTRESRSQILQQADPTGRVVDCEATLKGKDGQDRHVLMSADNLYIQDKLARFTVAVDLTRRRVAEEELLKQERIFELLVTRSRDLSILFDADGRPLFVGPQILQVLDCEEERFLDEVFQNRFHPEEEVRFFQNWNRLLRDRTPMVDEEFRLRNGIQTIHFSAETIDVAGKIFGIHGTAIDVTERKRREREALDRQFREAIGLLLSNVRHDIHNKLHALDGFLDLAGGRTCSMPDDPATLEKLRHDLARARQISEQIREISDQTQALSEYHRAIRIPSDVSLLLKTPGLLDARVPGVQVALQIEADLPEVSIDRQQMKMVLDCMYRETLDRIAGLAGSKILIRATALNADHATLRDLPGKPWVQIVFLDNGPSRDLEHLEDFFRIKSLGQGSDRDLRMAVVQSVVTKHEGVVRVAVPESGGNRLELFLPALLP